MPEIYDPSLKSLLAQTEEDWGVPEENRKDLVPYGIEPFDRSLYGIDVRNGELVIIMGQEKNRKTTFAINILINIMTGEKPAEKPVVVVDSLESGMHPARYRDQMICNLASRKIIGHGHTPFGCPECGTAQCDQLTLSPEYLRFHNRTPEQAHAIKAAISQMDDWPVYIFGANPFQGDTRNLDISVRGGNKPLIDAWHVRWAKENGIDITRQDQMNSRWQWFVHEKGAKIFITDHVQQYAFSGDPNDYEKQVRAVGAVGDFVAMWQVAVIMLSQVSLTSVREARSGGRMRAMGGSKVSQEANVSFSTKYTPGDGYMNMEILESRKSNTFGVRQPLDDTSGAFYGSAEFYSGVD